MEKTLCLFNQKGGVGKTTAAVNIAASLGIKDRRVLLVDMDPQGNTTSGVGVDKKEWGNAYDVLIGEMSITNAIVKTGYQNLHLLGTNNRMAGLEIELAQLVGWESMLKERLKAVYDYYDYIVIDCPPSLGILSVLSLVAADGIIVPIQCEYYSLEGVGQLYETYKMIKKKLNPDLEIEGVLISMFDSRTNLANQVLKEAVNFFGEKVYRNFIPRNVRLAEAPSFGKPICYYDCYSPGGLAFQRLASEIIARIEV